MRSKIIPILALAIFLTMTILPAAASGSNIDRVYHEPTVITADDEVTVNLEVHSKDNITSVRYYFCQKEPDDICYLEDDMTNGSGNNYSATIQKFPGGSKVGYNITIEYDDGSKEYTAPEPDGYHFYYVEGDDNDKEEDASYPGIPMMSAALALVLAVLWMRKH